MTGVVQIRRVAILAWLRDQYEPATVKQIADALCMKVGDARNAMRGLVAEGLIVDVQDYAPCARGLPGKRPALWVAA